MVLLLFSVVSISSLRWAIDGVCTGWFSNGHGRCQYTFNHDNLFDYLFNVTKYVTIRLNNLREGNNYLAVLSLIICNRFSILIMRNQKTCIIHTQPRHFKIKSDKLLDSVFFCLMKRLTSVYLGCILDYSLCI